MHFFRSLLVLPVLASWLLGQVPDGWFVTSSFQVGGFGGPAGVFLVDPFSGSVIPVTNLPPEVTGAAWPGAVVSGTDFVLRRPSDGMIVTNGSGVANVQMPVFFLQLSGSSVVASTRYDVGTITSTAGRGIPQAQVMDDGSVAIAVDPTGLGAPGEVLAGQVLGIVDPTAGPPGAPGTVRAVPVTPIPAGGVNGMAIDPARGTAYLGMINPPMASEVWAVGFPGGGAPRQIATIAETITNLAIDNDGAVLVTCSGSGGLYRVDPAAGTATRLAPTTTNLNGVTVERVTGDYIVAEGPPGPRLLRITPAGASTPVSAGPPGGWGTLVGVDVDHDPEVFGIGTPGLSTYRWRLAPNPGGLPTVGNAGFGLALEASPAAPLFSGFVASLGPQIPALPIQGMQVYLDPSGVVVSVSAVGSTLWSIPFGVPPSMALSGLELYCQTFHLEANNRLASSAAVRITVL